MVNGQHLVNQKHALYLALDGDLPARLNCLDKAVSLPTHLKHARVCATFFRWFEKNKLVVDCLSSIHNISNHHNNNTHIISFSSASIRHYHHHHHHHINNNNNPFENVYSQKPCKKSHPSPCLIPFFMQIIFCTLSYSYYPFLYQQCVYFAYSTILHVCWSAVNWMLFLSTRHIGFLLRTCGLCEGALIVGTWYNSLCIKEGER